MNDNHFKEAIEEMWAGHKRLQVEIAETQDSLKQLAQSQKELAQSQIARDLQINKLKDLQFNSVEIYSEDRIKEFSKMNNEELDDFNI